MNYTFDVNVITQALRNGSSQEDLANAFAASLNQAAATVKQERALQKQNEANKLKAAQAVADFYNTYYPELMGDKKVEPQTIIDACESIKKLANSTNELLSKVQSKIEPKNAVENPLFRIFNL